MSSRSRPSRSVFLEVFALAQSVRQLLLTTMRDGPLTPEEYALYSVIFEAETVPPTEMARRLGMPLTTVMEHVRRLEQRGHAKRIPDARDHRSYRLSLSARGLAAHREANRRFEEAYEAFLQALSGDEARAQVRLAQVRSAADRATSALTAATVRRPSSARRG